MGNYRFRLSEMIPNVWFYKMKDMGRTRRNHSSGGRDNNNHTRKKQNPVLSRQPHDFYPRKSYYFTRELVPGGGFESKSVDPPRKSSKQPSGKISPRKTTSGDSSNPPQEFRSDCILTTEFSCKLNNVPELKVELPPIKCRRSSVVKEERITAKENTKKNSSGTVRKFTVNSPGVRLRVNSPRLASRRIQGRKSASSSSSSSSMSGSIAVVKSSSDPQRDFRESMVEMIMENNIRASKDLEDLLACYLSLNSNEYHDVIVKVFKQIWLDLCLVRMK